VTDELRARLDATLAPLSIAMDVELNALLPHPRLGPLVRQLSLYAQRPAFSS